MSNPNFDPQHSTFHIWRGDNMEQCLEDELLAMEEAIDDKAPTNHEHSEYAAESHAHTGYAASLHNHELAQIAGLVAALLGKADLVDGKVPESQLPSYVDDVVDGTLVNATTFNNASGTAVTPESGKIYNDTNTNKSYRWSGTQYVSLGAGVALGETSATAFRGDHGKAAYEHSQDSNVHVTPAQMVAWDSKAPGDHTHTPAALYDMASALFGTSISGGVEYYYGQGSGKNLLTEMAAWPQGLHTAYSYGGTEGNPKNTESWRVYCHKTSAAIGWVLAFGTSGSIFSNYYDTTWKGWRTIYDALPAPLWTGEMYMSANQVVTPSKPLSECAHGWMLLWGDYNPGEGVQNVDFATTFITNRAYTGQKWAGGQWLGVVPRFADESGEAIVVKTLQVHDTKLVGIAINSVSPRNDVVLRAVYEF